MATLDLDRVLRALDQVTRGHRRPIALHEPRFRGKEKEYLLDCVDSGWVSSVGAYVDRLEKELALYLGVRRAVAVVNGTAALHVCLRAVGVRPGDEVLLPTLTFIATANAVAYCGAVPHFVDSDPRTLGVDPAKLEEHLAAVAEVRGSASFHRRTGARLRALVVMHTFGHAVDLDGVLGVCRRFGLELIEDAAESLGTRYRGRHTGTFGRLSALSFNGNKIVTTGGGGAVVTDDETLADLVKHVTTTARRKHRWEFVHDEVGFNYRLPNVNAALGCAQLEQLDGFVEAKRRLAERYQRAFAGFEGARVFGEPTFSRSNYWLNALLLDPDFAADRDRLLEACNDRGLGVRPAWALMHTLPMFREHPRMDLSVAEDLARRIVNLPSSAALGLEPEDGPQ